MIDFPPGNWTLLGPALALLVDCASTTSRTGPPERAEHAHASDAHASDAHAADGPHGPHADAPASAGTSLDAPTTPATPDAESASPEPPRAALSEQDAFVLARPVFQRYCASCHTTKGDRSRAASLRHFRMDSYPLGGHHAAKIAATIRGVLGASGKPATMPSDRPGIVQGEELRLILEWAEAFDRAHPPGKGHGGHSH